MNATMNDLQKKFLENATEEQLEIIQEANKALLEDD